MTKTAYITSVNGTLMAEVDGIRYPETADVIWNYNFSFGETFEFEVDDEYVTDTDPGFDGYELADVISRYAGC